MLLSAASESIAEKPIKPTAAVRMSEVLIGVLRLGINQGCRSAIMANHQWLLSEGIQSQSMVGVKNDSLAPGTSREASEIRYPLRP